MNNEREIIYRDRFERKERLGSGSYGSVYKGTTFFSKKRKKKPTLTLK